MAAGFRSFNPLNPPAGGFGGGGFGGGGGGGGFMRSEFDSPSSPAGGAQAKSRRASVLTPVLAKQIQEAKQEGAELRIDGKAASMVTIVGVLRSIEPSNTSTDFVLDDGTGVVKCTKYLSEEDSDNQAQFSPHMYVRVYGALQNMMDTRAIQVLRMTRVQDFNEVTFHHLDAIHAHLHNKFGPPAGAAGAVAPFAVAGGGHAPGGAATHHQGGAGEAGDLTAVQRSVMDVFREFSDSEIGTTVAEVCKRLPFSRFEIEQAIKFLSGEGHLYSTVDEDHYRCTGS